MKFYYYFALIILTPALFGGNIQAEVIFQDNFDSQADWEPTSPSECNSGDCSATVPVGWSYYRSMGVFNNTTNHNTMNLSSEHRRGDSGKGWTTWTESATPWSADSQLTYYSQNQEYDEVYVQFWFKLQSGWRWDTTNDGFLKLFRIAHYTGNGNIYYYVQDGAVQPQYIFDVKNSINWGWRHTHSFRSAPGYNYLQNDSDPEFSADFNAPGQLGDGDWHKMNFYFKMNSKTGETWNSDGEQRFWMDDVLLKETTGIRWIESGPYLGWNTIAIGGNQQNVFTNTTNGDEQWYTVDDIIISTAPITDTPVKEIKILNVEMN